MEAQRHVFADAESRYDWIAGNISIPDAAQLDVTEVAVALLVDVNSSGGACSCCRSASRTSSVPRALMSKSRVGSVRLVVTATCEAR